MFENLEAGMGIDGVIEHFPVTREQIEGLMALLLVRLKPCRRMVNADSV
jgi:uncharacterized protein (DUF433 family)